MSPEAWQRVKDILDNVLEIPTEAQTEFIRQAAPHDQEVADEVLRLLDALGSTGGFLEQPAIDLNGFLLPKPTTQPLLHPGSRLANRFEIRRFIAAGGMGEVYEAWDGVLRESVALKTIRADIATSAEVIERFRQEVRNARVISHPNICRVHELFSHDTETGERTWFLSMELLEGNTLSQCIRKHGKLPARRALQVAAQLADGLEAAHAHGLVHRDFKSSNVMLNDEDSGSPRAVIMDFGLSIRMLKSLDDGPEHSGAGTPGYMAPEQAAGGEVGPLADQYAFGIVLCEMLTGERPKSASGTLRGRPRMLMPSQHFPPRCERVICRCVEQDPSCRFPNMRSAAKTLAPPGLLGTPWRIAAALLLVTALAGGLWKLREYRNRCLLCDVVQLTPDNNRSEGPSLSRDGKVIAYSSDRAEDGNLDIFLQHLPNGQPIRLTSDVAVDADPGLSADGRIVVFRSERKGGGIYRKNVDGGDEILLAPQGRNPQISPDQRNVLYWTGDLDPTITSGKLYKVPIQGGEPVRVAASFQDARYPVWSPDGQAVLFAGCPEKAAQQTGCSDLWVTSLDGRRVQETHVMDALTKRTMTLAMWSSGRWEGDEIFFSAKSGAQYNLWSIGLDPATWAAVGSPRRLLPDNARDLEPSLARDGTVAYTRLVGGLHVWKLEANTAGQMLDPEKPRIAKITDDADMDSTPFVTENGKFLIFVRGKGTDRSLLVRNLSVGSEDVISEAGGRIYSPTLDDTGEWLAYSKNTLNTTSIFGGRRGEPSKQICADCGQPTGWFDTNRAFFYKAGTPPEIRMSDPRTGTTQVLLKEAGASLGDASWSPSTEFLLFTEVKEDRKRIFAVRLPRRSGQIQGSWAPIPTRGFPEHPRWSGDGREIFYVSSEDGFKCIYGQRFSPEDGVAVGEPIAIAHFHHGRSAIDTVLPRAFNLSVSGTTMYFNLGDQSSTVQLGSRSERR